MSEQPRCSSSYYLHDSKVLSLFFKSLGYIRLSKIKLEWIIVDDSKVDNSDNKPVDDMQPYSGILDLNFRKNKIILRFDFIVSSP